jgi:hypothetical protein
MTREMPADFFPDRAAADRYWLWSTLGVYAEENRPLTDCEVRAMTYARVAAEMGLPADADEEDVDRAVFAKFPPE